MKDLFICHASEDKLSVVLPLARALDNSGISYWLDKAEIKWGDSITKKINDGLGMARFVIVILSPSFILKKWPQKELNAALNIEISSGEIKVLPLLVGNKEQKRDIFSKIPLLNEKLYLSWEGNAKPIVEALKSRLSGDQMHSSHKNLSPSQNVNSESEKIYIPTLKKSFTQRDRDLFAKESFETIKNYFQKALQQLKNTYDEIDIDFTEINSLKFISKIYFNGDVRCKCKIWVGGFSGPSESICYSENYFDINDKSYNEIINIKNDGRSLYLEFSMGTFYQQTQNQFFAPSKAAEEFWKRFTQPLSF